MKVIIAGSRDIVNYDIVLDAIVDSKINITTVVSGGARGVDRLGERYAKEYNLPIEQYIPDWDGLGKKAGYVRNEQMADNADALIAIWDGVSKGTGHMINIAKRKNLTVFIYHTKYL